MAKIAVLSYSGSTGKTLIAMHLLKPFMPNAQFYAIETINQSAADLGVENVHTLAGKDLGELIEELVLEDDAIIDIGASNVERFFEEIGKYDGATDEIEYFIIPVTPEAKSWQEGAKAASALREIGIPSHQILIMPNRIEYNPKEEVSDIYAMISKTNLATIDDEIYMLESEVYSYLDNNGLTLDSLVSDDQDYRLLAKQAEDSESRKKYARLYRWQKQALPVYRHNVRVFNKMMQGVQGVES